MQEQHSFVAASPEIEADGITFTLHDHTTRRVQVLGSWDGWQDPGLEATCIEAGLWQTSRRLLPGGRHAYKFLLDGSRWLDDPANPHKMPDGLGGLNSVLNLEN